MKGLYRGFCRNENGTETIVLNGEKIKGKWVQGFLATEYHIIDDTDSFTYFGGGGMDGFAKIVIPETICEAVRGLTDRNGKQVFEGDIVNCVVIRGGGTWNNWERIININHGKCRTIPLKVVYDNKYSMGSFGRYNLKLTQKARELIEEYKKPIGAERTIQNINWYNVEPEDVTEVIGTIFDEQFAEGV